MEVLRWNATGAQFESVQLIPSAGAMGLEAFVSGGVQHLAVVNVGPSGGASDRSAVYAFSGETRSAPSHLHSYLASPTQSNSLCTLNHSRP